MYSRPRINNGHFLLTYYGLDYTLKTNTVGHGRHCRQEPLLCALCSVLNISCAVYTMKANQLAQITAQMLWISSGELLFFNMCVRIFNHVSVMHIVFTDMQLGVKPTFL